MNTTWSKILSYLQENVPKGQFSVWLEPLKVQVVGTEKNPCLEMFVLNDMVRSFVQLNLEEMILIAAEKVLGVRPQIKIEIEKTTPTQSNTQSVQEFAHTLPSSPAVFATNEQLSIPFSPMFNGKNFRYSFDDFVVGNSNCLAHAAAESMLNDTTTTDMLFLSSSSGLGKTHLVQAVGQRMLEKGSANNKRMLYLSAEEFTTKFVQSSKNRQQEEFKAYFSGLDLLLLEDVHFLHGKEKTQEALLSTIKRMQSAGGRVILTSSFAPRDIVGIDNDLVSHFYSGFVASIERPDMETRLHILMDKARRQDIILPDSVAELIASRVHSDIRMLESCLHNLALKARILKVPFSNDLAMSVIHSVATQKPSLDLDEVIRLVCKAFNFTPQLLCSNSRRKELVIARDAAFYLLRKHTDMTLKDIGTTFNRKHSTVIKGISHIESQMKIESPMGRQVSHAISMIERSGATA